jgi:hypothetical protein
MPLVNDVRKLAGALARATVALTGPSATSYRERMEKPIDTTSMASFTYQSAWGLGFALPPGFSGMGLPDPVLGNTSLATYDLSVVQRYESRQWIVSQFVRLPPSGSLAGKAETYLSRFDELMRFDLTPADLWQLAPWSWLVDWFVDIGGLISTWQTATTNKILSTYAYAMRHEVRTTSFFVTNLRAEATGYTYSGPKALFGQYVTTRKRRLRANPFGFIPNPQSALNGGQLAILGALGLTNVRPRTT